MNVKHVDRVQYGQKVAPARADLCIFILLLSVLLMIDERAEKGRKEERVV